MSPNHCDQMSQRSQVSRIALCRSSLNVFVFVFVIVFVVVFLLVRSCPLITLIKCLKGHKSLGSLLQVFSKCICLCLYLCHCHCHRVYPIQYTCCVLICLISVSFETRKRLKLVTTFSPDSLNLNSHNNLVMPWIESGYLTYFQKCLRLTLSVSFGHIMAPHHSDPMSKM